MTNGIKGEILMKKTLITVILTDSGSVSKLF